MSWEQIQPFMVAVLSLLAIVDPLGCLPVFTTMTMDVSDNERRFMYRLAGMVSMVTVMVMAVIGEFILQEVFHVRFGSFMIGGGLLLVVIGVRDIVFGHGGSRLAAKKKMGDFCDHRREQLIARAVSPLACPFLVGPGSIVTSMLIVSEDKLGLGMGLLAVATAFVVVLLILNWGHLLSRILGKIGPIVIARIMMIFITALGVEFIYQGIIELIKDASP